MTPSTPVMLTMCAAAYLLGAIPVGLLLGKCKGVDIRAHGSGNIGATNAMRVLGKPLGRLCFALDVLKGAAPTAIAGWLLGAYTAEPIARATAWAWLAVAAAAVVGHIFPVYLRFKGGKGVATSFGAMLAVWPYLTLPTAGALVVWIAMVKTFRYVGVASCLAALSLPIFVVALHLVRDGGSLRTAAPFFYATAGLALLVIVRHRGNIARTIAGAEPRVGERKDR